MTSNEFEVLARVAVTVACKRLYEEDVDTDDVQIVWFAHVLGNKKAILIANGPNNRIFEVTYNKDTDEMYIDCYEKAAKVIASDITSVLEASEE